MLGLFTSIGAPQDAIVRTEITNGTEVGNISEPGPAANPPAVDPGTAPLPKTQEELWQWGLTVATVVVTWALGKVPQLPRPVLPLITPVLGILLGVGLNALTRANFAWVDLAQVGALAVFIRESVNQVVTKQMMPLEESKTNTKPVDKAITVSKDAVGARIKNP